MIINHNDKSIGLPDIPLDLSNQFPYAVIMYNYHIMFDDISYLLIISDRPFRHLDGDLFGEPIYEELETDGSWDLYQVSDDSNSWVKVEGETSIVLRPESYVPMSTLRYMTPVWSNHDVFKVAQINEDGNEVISTDIYFLRSTGDYEPEYSMPSDWYRSMSDKARGASGEVKRYVPDDILSALSISNVKGVKF